MYVALAGFCSASEPRVQPLGMWKQLIQSAIGRSLFSMESGNRSIRAPHCRLCCRYLLLLAACVSRQLTTKRYRKCQGICFVALQHNSDPRSSCDSVSRASARSRRAQSWWCANAGSSQGGAGHGEHLSRLRVQLCTLSSRGAVQSKPRWLSPPRTSRQCPHARRSRAVDTGRGVLGPARAAHIPPATKGFTCAA